MSELKYNRLKAKPTTIQVGLHSSHYCDCIAVLINLS